MNHAQDTTVDPSEASHPAVRLTELPQSLQDAAARAGWTSLMPVQSRTIPFVLDGRDVMVQARTGSGKTGAFLLPMLERLDPARAECQTLILVPTRELARQVRGEAKTILEPAGLRSIAVYGGVGYGEQIEALKQGAQVVIGTPGRVIDHLIKRTFTLDHLRMLVFDEADRMLSMGFYEDMLEVRSYLPDRHVYTCMFSATFPDPILRTARRFMRDPEQISLSTDHVHVTTTEHIAYEVPGVRKDRVLVKLFELENPTAALIFCNTKVNVHFVSTVLQRYGYNADELSADLSQPDRERVLGRVRAGNLRFLVATDVAARGIDIPELSHVFQYEPPEDTEAYIHRAGRTGRAGASGVAITLINRAERYLLRRIAKQYDIDFQEKPLPTDEEVEAVVGERLTAVLEARLRNQDKLRAERSQRFAPLARELAQTPEGTELLAMLLDEGYQQMLQAAVAPAGEEEKKKSSNGGDRSRSRRRSRRRSGRR